MTKQHKLPELLAPAGSPEALRAAIEGGADAVYFGGSAFNARMRAQNFSGEAMAENIDLCHRYGLKAYVTLNTLCTDRELPAFLASAAEALNAGADALIVADLGAATAIHQHFPRAELHASTQACGHSISAARELSKLGFTRMVLAREVDAENMRRFVAECGLETEVFIHGALCVSHSGQCLFSSLVGGRSGNRGECAQPCRLPDARGKYPLSLKDLSLARHIPALMDMGVCSLKIEGRLKSPEYVRDVTRIFRTLLDEGRGATDGEMRRLAAIFSRGGFTDGYFTKKIDHDMMGVRSEQNKAESSTGAPFTGISRRIPLDMRFTMQAGAPISLSVTAGGKTATILGDMPETARTAPMDRAAVERCLTKLGGTPYRLQSLDTSLDAGLMVPVSRLNALRRAALDALLPEKCAVTAPTTLTLQAEGARATAPTARFQRPEQITLAAMRYFEHLYLPLDRYTPAADGVVLPPVILDDEVEGVRQQLQKAAAADAKHALVGNLGHLALAREAGLVPHGDFRLNVTNTAALQTLLSLGFADVLLSPELTLPQLRDIHGATDAIVYGRVPLMVLEKCVGTEVGSCKACAEDKNQLVDRRGEKFPILRLPPHRSLILNSRPTVMSDKKEELQRAGLVGGHFLFTLESPREVDAVISAYQKGTPLAGAVRRI
ncbi:MAG: U32 family peptidase [Clostridia bacterium]|nr:U32 family peptidase [Clostridia bacterium]